jgi:hypothetical protein
LQWLPNQSRKTLNAIEGVEASVSLEDATATITMEKHVPCYDARGIKSCRELCY